MSTITKIEATLLKGLGENRIGYYYQPILNTVTGRTDKVEVLLRVEDGWGGYFNTEELVTAAEKMSLIDEMDRQTFIHACNVLPEFRACGVDVLCVNLSPAACHAARLIPEVKRILAETGTDPASLCLEITEAAKLLSEEPLVETLLALHEIGVKLALDDFGTGYSNLRRMVSVPFYALKLDKSLIWGMEAGGIAQSLVENIVHFARENDMVVVAEGVETAEQAGTLTEMGCQYLQGYYYGKPMRAKDFFQHIKKETTESDPNSRAVRSGSGKSFCAACEEAGGASVTAKS